MAIHIRKRIDSETLHLPEIRPLIGKVVDITVEEEQPAHAAPPVAPPPLLQQASNEFWNPPSLEEIMRRQGKVPGQGVPVEELFGSFTAEDFEGFDEWLEEQRSRPWRAEPLDIDKDE